MKRNLLILLGIAAIALASAGCRTAEGFGEDVEKAGEKIQEKAR